ncbi:hypothetical protein N0V90_005140 [Kalmusia sp. IMI 367209]|nr:hypothetical protein N0V90_005140 [Kalmusia sp. IMI 367209]
MRRQCLAPLLTVLIWTASAVPFSNTTVHDAVPSFPNSTANRTYERYSGLTDEEAAHLATVEAAVANGTQPSKIPGTFSMASSMGLMVGDADTTDEPQLKLEVMIGWRRQHVGFTYEHIDTHEMILASRFRMGLHKLCPDEDSEWEERAHCRDGWWQLIDICYNVGCEANVKLRVLSDWSTSRNQQKLMIDTAYAMFKIITDCDTNRYQLQERGCREFANSADWIQVGIYGTGADVAPHLRVGIEFNGRTDEGMNDCVGALTALWASIPDLMLPKFSKEYGGKPFGWDAVCISKRVDGEFLTNI